MKGAIFSFTLFSRPKMARPGRKSGAANQAMFCWASRSGSVVTRLGGHGGDYCHPATVACIPPPVLALGPVGWAGAGGGRAWSGDCWRRGAGWLGRGWSSGWSSGRLGGFPGGEGAGEEGPVEVSVVQAVHFAGIDGILVFRVEFGRDMAEHAGEHPVFLAIRFGEDLAAGEEQARHGGRAEIAFSGIREQAFGELEIDDDRAAVARGKVEREREQAAGLVERFLGGLGPDDGQRGAVGEVGRVFVAFGVQQAEVAGKGAGLDFQRDPLEAVGGLLLGPGQGRQGSEQHHHLPNALHRA